MKKVSGKHECVCVCVCIITTTITLNVSVCGLAGLSSASVYLSVWSSTLWCRRRHRQAHSGETEGGRDEESPWVEPCRTGAGKCFLCRGTCKRVCACVRIEARRRRASWLQEAAAECEVTGWWCRGEGGWGGGECDGREQSARVRKKRSQVPSFTAKSVSTMWLTRCLSACVAVCWVHRSYLCLKEASLYIKTVLQHVASNRQFDFPMKVESQLKGTVHPKMQVHSSSTHPVWMETREDDNQWTWFGNGKWKFSHPAKKEQIANMLFLFCNAKTNRGSKSKSLRFLEL